MSVSIPVLQCPDSFQCGLFFRDVLMLRYGVRLFSIGLQFSYTGLRPFYPGIHLGYHPFLDGFHFF
jgi:hypothetical protein